MAKASSLSRAIIARRPVWLQLLYGAAGVAAAALLRWVIDRGVNGVPFATFIPVIVLACIFLDMFVAALVAACSIFIATWLFMAPWDARVSLPIVAFFLAYLITTVCLLFFGATLRAAIRETESQAQQLRTFNVELRHRMRNTLQLVQSIARMTARNASPDTFLEALSGRLDALSSANELLGHGEMGTTDLADLVRSAIGPFEPARFHIGGPSCQLPEDSGVPLMLALHELCTNAQKYGALSHPQGRVSIRWNVVPREPGVIKLDWEETGGPTVTPPERTGLGTRILQPQRGMVRAETRFEPAGLQCCLAVKTA